MSKTVRGEGLFPSKKLHSTSRDNLAGILKYERPHRNGRGSESVDYSDVRCVHAGFDTIESLYRGNISEARAGRLITWFERQKLHGVFDPVVWASGWNWIMRPAAKSSGFRWQLVNNDLGLIVFFWSTFTKELSGQGCTHFKVRAAPQFLLERSDAECVEIYDKLARELLDPLDGDEAPRREAVAVHICADLIGVTLPEDMCSRLSLRSKVVRDHVAQTDLKFVGSNVIQRFGGLQSLLAGSRKGLQFACYNKSQAAFEQDRTRLWNTVWEAQTAKQNFDYAGENVIRFEFRLHHTVLLQMERGTGIPLRDQIEVGHQIRNIWLKCLDTVRLDQSRDYVDPLWQYLAEEVTEFGNPPFLEIKRQYAYSSGSGFERKVIYAVAYSLSVWSCFGDDEDIVFRKMLTCGLWQPFELYCVERGRCPHEEVRRRLELKRLSGYRWATLEGV